MAGVVLAVTTLWVANAVPAKAVVTNPILGSIDAANPQSNAYSGCIAATLVGNGFSFSTLGLLGSQLATLWPSVPNPIAEACKSAIDGGQSQVCLVPGDPTICPGIGAAINHFWTNQAAALDGWDLIPDSGFFGGSAINHYPADVPVTAGPQASITFSIGQLTPQFCGGGCLQPITNLPFTIYGRTPSGAADGFHLRIDDNHGQSYDGEFCVGGCAGDPYGDPQPLCPPAAPCDLPPNTFPDGHFGTRSTTPAPPFPWQCIGAPDCSGWQLTLTMTFHGGYADNNNLFRGTSAGISRAWIQWSNGYVTKILDDAPWTDPRWSFGSAAGPVQVRDLRAQTPEAVLALASSNLACLLSLDLAVNPNATCPFGSGPPQPIVQPATKPPVLRPLIFVPGIAGSELTAVRDSPSGGRTFVDSHGSSKTESYTTGETIWLNGSKLEPLPQAFNDQEFLDLLRFDSSGNPLFGDFAPSGRFVTTTVHPPLAPAQTVAPYGNVIPALSRAGYGLGNNLFIFAYDWRYNADHARGDLDAMVGQVLTQTGATSVDIIAHSMGTMVTRDYLLYGANRSKVHSVVMLAPPNLGTVKGTVAVHQGVCLPDNLTGIQVVGNCYISDRTVRYIYRTIPGGLDQAPSQAYYAVYNGRDAAHPVAFRDDTVKPPAVDWAALAKYETAPGPSDTNCILVFCQDEAPVTTAAFNAANAFHNQEDDWYNRVNTPVAIMVGTGKCTIGQILKEPVVTFSRAGRMVSTRWDIRNIDGDGTVTRRSASLDDGRLAPNVTLYYRNFDHSGMGSESSVLADAVAILQGSPPAQGAIGAPNSKTCHQIIVESPMELQITDSQGRRLGSLDGQTDYREQPTNEFMRLDDTKNATIYGGGSFRADLQGTDDGEASIKMRVVGVDQTIKVLAFNHIPVTPKTKAFFTFDTNDSITSLLTVDPDGTGQHIQTIAPFEITSNPDDDVPPTIDVLAPRPGQVVVGNFAVNWTATKTTGNPVSQTFGIIDAGGASPQKVDRPGSFTVPAGAHTLDLYAEDALENSTAVHVDFTADSFAWMPPMSSAGITVNGNNATVPLRFSVTTQGGSLVNDASCIVSVVDPAGTALLSQPCSVDGSASFYHVNLDTHSLASGSYSVRVGFDSATLTGSFDAPLVKS